MTSLLTIVADTCGRHDTLGGACSRESNTMRYAHEKEYMHACRDSFICGVHAWRPDLGKRDIAPNINFFMNVPVTPDGRLTFADGVSAPGYYVELRAERDVMCIISNCPQLNNPCNAYNPTPIEVLIWDGRELNRWQSFVIGCWSLVSCPPSDWKTYACINAAEDIADSVWRYRLEHGIISPRTRSANNSSEPLTASAQMWQKDTDVAVSSTISAS